MENINVFHTKPVRGRVKGTGWPIDGHVLVFCKWFYDDCKNWHLYSWDDKDDDAVRDTFFQTMVEAGFMGKGDREEWNAKWKEGSADTPGSFTLDPSQVVILKTEQRKVVKWDE